jgi:adenosylcobinamide-phosphate synthase
MWIAPFTAPVPVLLLAALLALAVDRLFGELPSRWHPVVWMGAYLSWSGRRIAPLAGDSRSPRWRVFGNGVFAWLLGAALVLMVALLLVSLMSDWVWWGQVLALGFLLKPLLAWRMLRDEVLAVEAALEMSLAAGRERLAWLVSRDVESLCETQVRESAIETLAENLNDSVVAPLFWIAIAGLPGAALYRFANTADAMWGYLGERGGRDWTWAGKWAARADDVLSWMPARLTALLLALLGGCVAPARLPGQASRTPSPNSGWPMAAMALVLDVRLAKPGVYVLNETGRTAQAGDTARAAQLGSRLVQTLAAMALLVAATLLWRAAP